jgi:serine/threonine protein kinase
MAGKSQMITLDQSKGESKAMITSSVGVKTVGADMLTWKYTKGDTIQYQNGKTAFTVRKSLGCGAFGEVHLVWNEIQQKPRAMKCTKFGNMTSDERMAMFVPMCNEALLMMELRHHPNIVSLRFVKVSGSEFLMIMDVADGSKELSEAYQDDTVWDPLCQDRNVFRITSFLSMLWYQLAQALDHLHSKLIMVPIAALSILQRSFLMISFYTNVFLSAL